MRATGTTRSTCDTSSFPGFGSKNRAQPYRGIADHRLAHSTTLVHDVDATATLFGAAYGKYINDNLEVKLDVIYANADLGGLDAKAWIVGPAVLWNFTPKTPSAIVPYVGVGAVWASVDGDGDSDTSTSVEYMAGVKFFIGGNYDCADKNVFVEYRHTNIDIFGSGDTVNMVWTGIVTIF